MKFWPRRNRALRAGLALTLAAGLLGACGGNRAEDKFVYIERPVEVIYNDAITLLEKKRYSEAVLQFGEVERQHPYSAWARRAMLMSAYASYQSNDYEEAITSLDRFIALHPGNSDVSYAYYLKAVSYYERIVDVGRDQKITVEALTALRDVVRRFPESEYARDARLKIDLTMDHLAGKEMFVGRYYLRKNQHVAAINRFKVVLDQYQTTTHVPEALHRMTEAYLELGVIDEALRTTSVLGHNYRGSEWYSDSYRLLARRGFASANASDPAFIERLNAMAEENDPVQQLTSEEDEANEVVLNNLAVSDQDES